MKSTDMAHPVISVVVPVYNEPPEILDNISQIASFNRIAEVLVADASTRLQTTESLEYLQKSNGKIRLIDCQSPGRAKQMNKGAELATGDILWFIHADTILPDRAPEFVSRSIVNHCEWGRFHVRFSSSLRIMKLVAGLMNYRSWLTGICTGDQAIFVSRQLFFSVGKFPDISLMEDIALTKKLRKSSRPICIRIPVVTSARRWEKNGPIRTIMLMWKLRLLYWTGVSPDRLAVMYKADNQ